MKIIELTLYTNEISNQLKFYSSILGFKIIEESTSSFSVQVGHSKLTFKESEKSFIYHYCFLIPSNKLNESIEWLNKRVAIISYENGRVIEPASKEWNADSVYFLDPAGNILEFIVRYDLNNFNHSKSFDLSQILCVNEIGMPSKNLKKINRILVKKLGSKLWTGNLERFGANGTQDGLFLLVNYNTKRNWFPTEVVPAPSPFYGVFESNGLNHQLSYDKEEIVTHSKGLESCKHTD
ncbi:MAG: glyoxalase [Crocinitomicaceae bacterium]|nr:glyoxalase [Crocinitomicaceae bacterium]